MLRTVSIILALAVLPLFPASGSPLHRVKLHRGAQATVASHNSGKSARCAAEGRAGHARVQRARYELPRETNRAARCEGSGRRQATLQTASLRLAEPEMPPPLRGSRESLERQNDKTEADGLERIEDEDDLADRIARKMLVPVPVSAALAVNGNLSESHRYCRPWTARFLSDLARVHRAEFHRPLEVSSAVRTVEYQKRLMGINGNAAPAEGEVASPHLTGASIDLAKLGMTRQEIAWLRSWLLPLQQAGKIDVEEEFQQSCFHITVYKAYAQPALVQADGHEKSEPDAAGEETDHQETDPPPSAGAAEIDSQSS